MWTRTTTGGGSRRRIHFHSTVAIKHHQLLSRTKNSTFNEPKRTLYHLTATASELTIKHHQLLTKDEDVHLQRAKKNRVLHGDRNTTYFHQAIAKRTRKNRIAYLQNPDGTKSTTQEQLSATFMAYFQDIFSTAVPSSHTIASPLTNHFHADFLNAGSQPSTTQQDQHFDTAAAPQVNEEPHQEHGGHDEMNFTNSCRRFRNCTPLSRT